MSIPLIENAVNAIDGRKNNCTSWQCSQYSIYHSFSVASLAFSIKSNSTSPWWSDHPGGPRCHKKFMICGLLRLACGREASLMWGLLFLDLKNFQPPAGGKVGGFRVGWRLVWIEHVFVVVDRSQRFFFCLEGVRETASIWWYHVYIYIYFWYVYTHYMVHNCKGPSST